MHVSIRHCQETACGFYEVPLIDLLAKRRGAGISRYRAAAIWLAMRLSSHGSSVIGRAFGCDHTSVLYAVARIEGERAGSPLFAGELEELIGVALGTWRGLVARGFAEGDFDPVAIARRVVDLPRGATDATIPEIRTLALAVLAAAAPAPINPHSGDTNHG